MNTILSKSSCIYHIWCQTQSLLSNGTTKPTALFKYVVINRMCVWVRLNLYSDQDVYDSRSGALNRSRPINDVDLTNRPIELDSAAAKYLSKVSLNQHLIGCYGYETVFHVKDTWSRSLYRKSEEGKEQTHTQFPFKDSRVQNGSPLPLEALQARSSSRPLPTRSSSNQTLLKRAYVYSNILQLRHYRGRLQYQRSSKPSDSETENGKHTESAELDIAGAGVSFEEEVNFFHSEMQTSANDFGNIMIPASVDDMTLPELSRHAYNLVPYVKKSETLQKLVMLGVNLDVVQKVRGVPELLLRSKFERDIAPLLHLLHLMGIPGDEMGLMLTRNPLLFTESIEDVSARFGYLLHKNFSQREAACIVMRAPVTLLMDVSKLDSKLVFLQNTFGLKAHEVRQTVLKHPKLLPWRRDMMANVRFHLKTFLAFSDVQLKELLLKEPKLYMLSTGKLTETFDYLQTSMGLTRQQILIWPGILNTRLHIIKSRHQFLESLGRAQYDPCKENFVSLKALGTGLDTDFCTNVAKCDLQRFHNFLKTL